MKNAIEFNNIWKKFKRGEKFNSLRDAIPNFFRKKIELEAGEFWALKDVSFEIEKGEVLGIIGPNGAGKSTILKLLSGIIIPNKGTMSINGRLAALIEVGAGFHNDLTGRENIYLNGTILGMTRKEIDSKFDRIVEFSGLSEFIDTPVKRYSSGMYSRLGFSVAAHMDPDILLVDEVLSVGDMAFQARCAEKMRELLGSGATIILISHNLPLVQNMCKKVILLHKGQILNEGHTNDVIPLYEKIVYSQREEEVKKEASKLDYKVKVREDSLVSIDEVAIYDGASNKKDIFSINEHINLQVLLGTKKKIERPVVSVEIVRADGVICCATNTKQDKFDLGNIDGKKTIEIGLGDINLLPGVYVLRLAVWDKDMLHPFCVRKQDILKIEGASLSATKGIFNLKVKWKLY
jgi:lipopolysaccharide transport system ATP-binding protein